MTEQLDPDVAATARVLAGIRAELQKTRTADAPNAPAVPKEVADVRDDHSD